MADLLVPNQLPWFSAQYLAGSIKPFQSTHLITVVGLVSLRHCKGTWHRLEMAHSSTRRDNGNNFYRGDPLPQPEVTPQPYLPERERANAPLHIMPVVSVFPIYRTRLGLDDKRFEAAPPHCTSFSPQWNAPALHSNVQEQRGGVLYNVWPDAQRNLPFVDFSPAKARLISIHERSLKAKSFLSTQSAVAQYKDQNQDPNTANGTTAYQQDNKILTGKDVHGQLPTTVRFT